MINPYLETQKLTGWRILQIYQKLDSHLQRPVQILVVGGAALAVHWYQQGTRERVTHDVDMTTIHKADTTPLVVDVVSNALPKYLVEAALEVAEEQNMFTDWLNNRVTNVMPEEVDYQPELIWRGEHLEVYRPSLTVLLAMKLKSARDPKDLDDAVFLADELGVATAEDQQRLVADTYGPDNLTTNIRQFINKVVATYQLSRSASDKPES